MEDLVGIIVVVALVAWLFVGYPVGRLNGYKQGQIDALNGVVRYQLVTKDDGTVEWELIVEPTP